MALTAAEARDILDPEDITLCRNPRCMGVHEPETFGCCYNCRDGLCDECVGVPCDCPCIPPEVQRWHRITALRAELAQLEADAATPPVAAERAKGGGDAEG